MTQALPEDVVFRPEPRTVAGSHLTDFRQFWASATGRQTLEPAALDRSMVEDFRTFWKLLLEWSPLTVEGDREPICVGDDVETAEFFPRLRLNYVENLLREIPAAEDKVALIAHHENGADVTLTRSELRQHVSAVAQALQQRGVLPGDRVVAVSGNIEQLVIVGLAATGLGATLSTVAPELGTPALLARCQQLEPQYLLYFAADPASPPGHAVPSRLSELVSGLSTLKAVVLLDPAGHGPVPPRVETWSYEDLVTREARTPVVRTWPRFPFSHPLWILFSSGTTGAPKCLVHTAGGSLLEHYKEHTLHGDLGENDVLFFQTSPAWMMWNWLISALMTGAAIVLNDAPVTGPGSLWSVVEHTHATVFGTGPTYLQFCRTAGYEPAKAHELSALRSVMSTGSVLYADQFDWVRQHVGDLPLQSISGGTDIVGCFLLGNPLLPVRRGRLQSRSLGLDVRVENSDPVTGIGELICANPFPSRPSGLLDDASGQRFHAEYFAENPGVWTHGDLVEIDEDGSARIHGRSDGVMNINGVRIAPGEIYSLLTDFPEIQSGLAIEQRLERGSEQSRMVLLVVLREGDVLDDTLETRIREHIGHSAGGLYVPDLVAAVPDIPRTYSGKDSERAARDVLNGKSLGNRQALRNPESLEAIQDAVEMADRVLRQRKHAERDVLLTSDHQDLATDLAGVFSMVLGTHADVDENFFDLGGTSLQIVYLSRAIQTHLGFDIPLSAVFSASTPRKLSEFILAEDAVQSRPAREASRG